jgi:predicted DCC family thiol-disulfide oxidoreductase YuxK
MDGSPVILFDGVCNLCNHSVDFVLRRDRKRRFRYASLQSDAGRALLRAHGLPTDNLDTLVLLHGGRAYVRSAAALRIASQLGGLWRLTVLLLAVPTPLRDGIYRWIAANRYRWFGRQDTCRMPHPEEKALFL